MKIFLLSVILIASSSGVIMADYPVGDLDGNCKVNLEDLRLFGEQWLEIVSLIKIFCLLALANTLISLSKYLLASTGETRHILKFTLRFRPVLIAVVILVTIFYKNTYVI